MNGLVKVGFIDKNTGRYFAENQKVEFADVRIKELARLGYVEIKDAPKTEPAVKAEMVEKKVEKLPVKATAKKPTTKKK